MMRKISNLKHLGDILKYFHQSSEQKLSSFSDVWGKYFFFQLLLFSSSILLLFERYLPGMQK